MMQANLMHSVDEQSVAAGWLAVCDIADVLPGTGVAARLYGQQLAIFNTPAGIFAIGNRDPFSGANVLSRGLPGDIGGVVVVASPVYKQHFCLKTGRCIEDSSVQVPVYPVKICAESRHILVRLSAS